MSKKEHQQNLLRKLGEKRRLESQVDEELASLKTSYNKAMTKIRDFLPKEFANEISSKFGEVVWNPEKVLPSTKISKHLLHQKIFNTITALERDTIIEAKASKFVTQHVDQIQSETKFNLQISLKSEILDVNIAFDEIKNADDIHQLIAALRECAKAFDALTKALTLES